MSADQLSIVIGIAILVSLWGGGIYFRNYLMVEHKKQLALKDEQISTADAENERLKQREAPFLVQREERLSKAIEKFAKEAEQSFDRIKSLEEERERLSLEQFKSLQDGVVGGLGEGVAALGLVGMDIAEVADKMDLSFPDEFVKIITKRMDDLIDMTKLTTGNSLPGLHLASELIAEWHKHLRSSENPSAP